MVAKQEHVSIMHDVQLYTIFILHLAVLCIIIFIILNARKLSLLKGHLFSNAVKIMLFISDAQYYVPVKLCRTTGSIHILKMTRKLSPKHIELKEVYFGML